MIISLSEKNNKVLNWIKEKHPCFYDYFKRMIEEEGKNYSIKKAQSIINLTSEIGSEERI